MFFSDISTLFSKCDKNVMCLLGILPWLDQGNTSMVRSG